jgi:hypothetical protein
MATSEEIIAFMINRRPWDIKRGRYDRDHRLIEMRDLAWMKMIPSLPPDDWTRHQARVMLEVQMFREYGDEYIDALSGNFPYFDLVRMFHDPKIPIRQVLTGFFFEVEPYIYKVLYREVYITIWNSIDDTVAKKEFRVARGAIIDGPYSVSSEPYEEKRDFNELYRTGDAQAMVRYCKYVYPRAIRLDEDIVSLEVIPAHPVKVVLALIHGDKPSADALVKNLIEKLTLGLAAENNEMEHLNQDATGENYLHQLKRDNRQWRQLLGSIGLLIAPDSTADIETKKLLVSHEANFLLYMASHPDHPDELRQYWNMLNM